MKTPRSVLILTAINVGLALFSIARQTRPAVAENEPPILRGRALEIVDGEGRVRASIGVLPNDAGSDRASAETVLLRLITERGRPTVKIAASEPRSGLSFAGPTGTKDAWVRLEAKGTTTALELRDEDGREKVLTP